MRYLLLTGLTLSLLTGMGCGQGSKNNAAAVKSPQSNPVAARQEPKNTPQETPQTDRGSSPVVAEPPKVSPPIQEPRVGGDPGTLPPKKEKAPTVEEPKIDGGPGTLPPKRENTPPMVEPKQQPPVSPPKKEVSIRDLIANAKALKPGAIDELAAVGPKAIPAIIDELRFDDTRYSWAAASMAKMGPDAVGPVANLLNDNDYFMRKIAYMTLGQMGPIARPALPALQRAAQLDGDPRNRGLAENAISQITER